MQRRQTATEVCSWEWGSSLLGDLLSGCLISQINELKVCKRGSVCWKAAIWFLHLMQLYQASASRNWWAIWPRFWKQGIEVLSHLTALMGTLNSDDWLCMAKMSGLTSLAKSLLMLMCLVPQLWWTSFCKKQDTPAARETSHCTDTAEICHQLGRSINTWLFAKRCASKPYIWK